MAWSSETQSQARKVNAKTLETFYSLGAIWKSKQEAVAQAQVYLLALDWLDIGCLAMCEDEVVKPINRAGTKLAKGQLLSQRRKGRAAKVSPTNNDRPTQLAIWEMPSGETRPAYLQRATSGFGFDVHQLIFVPSTASPAITPQAIQIGLGLTQSEAGLTAQLARGRKVSEAATALGLSEQTGAMSESGVRAI